MYGWICCLSPHHMCACVRMHSCMCGAYACVRASGNVFLSLGYKQCGKRQPYARRGTAQHSTYGYDYDTHMRWMLFISFIAKVNAYYYLAVCFVCFVCFELSDCVCWFVVTAAAADVVVQSNPSQQMLRRATLIRNICCRFAFQIFSVCFKYCTLSIWSLNFAQPNRKLHF